MKPFAAVLGKEVYERRLLLLAALLLGLIPLAMQWTVHWRGIAPDEMRDYTALLIAALFAAGAAIALGSSLISRELLSRRLGFYFVRPLGTWSLWWGKLGAVLLLLAGSLALIWLPSLLAGSRPWTTGFPFVELPKLRIAFWPPPTLWGLDSGVPFESTPYLLRTTGPPEFTEPRWLAAAVGLLLLVLLAHGLSVIVRARSAWTLFDTGMILAVSGTLAACAGRFEAFGARPGVFESLVLFVAALVLVGLLAPWLQLWHGRSSTTRSHGSYSVILWGSLLAVAVALLGLAHLATRAAPRDLAEVWNLEAAPQGEWMVLGGPVRSLGGFLPAFAVNAEDGRSHAIAPLPFLGGPPVFSADGRTVVWNECRPGLPACELHLLEVGRPHPEARATGILTVVSDRSRHSFGSSEGPGRLALSPAGDRVALMEPQNLTVYDTSSDGLLASVRLPAWRIPSSMSFESRDLLRIFVVDFRRGPLLEVWELDVPRKSLTRAAEHCGYRFALSPDGERMAVWGTGTVKVFDRTTTRELLELPVPHKRLQLRFLSGGEMVVTERDPSRLTVFSAHGEELRTIELPGPAVILGGEPTAGRILVGVRSPAAGQRRQLDHSPLHDLGAFDTHLVDVGSGEHLRSWSGTLPGWHRSQPGSAAARLLIASRGIPGRLDPGSGAIEPILAASPAK